MVFIGHTKLTRFLFLAHHKFYFKINSVKCSKLITTKCAIQHLSLWLFLVDYEIFSIQTSQPFWLTFLEDRPGATAESESVKIWIGVNRVFHKHTELAILTSEALLCQKKFNNKMWPQWVLNLGPQSFRSNDLPSELVRHVLLERSKIFIWSFSIGSN